MSNVDNTATKSNSPDEDWSVRQFKLTHQEVHPDTGEPLRSFNDILTALRTHDIFKKWSFIVHDNDTYSAKDVIKKPKAVLGEPKPKHIHVAVNMGNSPYKRSRLAKIFGIPANFILKPNDDDEDGNPKPNKKDGSKTFLLDMTEYMVHEKDGTPLPDKWHYSDNEVITSSNFENWRELLTELNTKRRKNAEKRKSLDWYIKQVSKHGKTLKSCYLEMDEPTYIRSLNLLKSARHEYIRYAITKPHSRINCYVEGGGGDGKDTCCTLFARNLAETYYGFDTFGDDIDDFVYYVGGKGVLFEGYAGQPIIIWSDVRIIEMLMSLGRTDMLKIFDAFPRGSSIVNVKFNHVLLRNSINLLNGVIPCSEFLSNWAGEYTDKTKVVHEAEDKSQTFRRVPIAIKLTENNFAVSVNSFALDGNKEHVCDYEVFAAGKGNFRKNAILYGTDEDKLYKQTKPMTDSMVKAFDIVHKVYNAPNPQLSDPRAIADAAIELTGGKLYYDEHPELEYLPEFVGCGTLSAAHKREKAEAARAALEASLPPPCPAFPKESGLRGEPTLCISEIDGATSYFLTDLTSVDTLGMSMCIPIHKVVDNRLSTKEPKENAAT